MIQINEYPEGNYEYLFIAKNKVIYFSEIELSSVKEALHNIQYLSLQIEIPSYESKVEIDIKVNSKGYLPGEYGFDVIITKSGKTILTRWGYDTVESATQGADALYEFFHNLDKQEIEVRHIKTKDFKSLKECEKFYNV